MADTAKSYSSVAVSLLILFTLSLFGDTWQIETGKA